MNRSLSHHSRNRFRPLFFALALLVLAALILIILEKTKTTDFIKMPVSSEQKQAQEAAEMAAKNNETQKKADEQQKQQFLDDTAENKTDSSAPETVATESGPLVNGLTAKQEGENVVVLTKLASVASGSCTLRITNGTKTHEQQARIIYQPEFSSCAGFNVQKSVLSSGVWSITLEATSGDLSGQKTIELGVK